VGIVADIHKKYNTSTHYKRYILVRLTLCNTHMEYTVKKGHPEKVKKRKESKPENY
jgi:hypothetical protein